MRLAPIMNSSRNFVNSAKNAYTKFESKNTFNQAQSPAVRQYTGVASADLAYASLFDDAIARDLKMMGLI